jgi:hypothetical protein
MKQNKRKRRPSPEKYFFVTYMVADGEYEYGNNSVVAAQTQTQAERLGTKDAREWVKGDPREVRDVSSQEVTRAEFDVLCQYVYCPAHPRTTQTQAEGE